MEVPDTSSFASWQDAFQYPIPAVRGIERQLGRDVAANKQRLRTMVESNAENLADMAQQVVDIEAQMSSIHRLNNDMLQRCHPRVIEKKTQNLRRWEQVDRAKQSRQLELTAQLAVLRSCPEVLLAILDEGQSILTAARVLVLARLMHAKLSKAAVGAQFLEKLKSRLASLRTRLLRRVERLMQTSAGKDALLEAMSAYALATSSSASDVLLHFFHLRQAAISDAPDIVIAVQLFAKTAQQAQVLALKALTKSLAACRQHPLVEYLDIEACPELNLDLHCQWLGDEMCRFTPFLRSDDLTQSKAHQQIRSWTTKGMQMLIESLTSTLLNLSGLKPWLSIRRQILQFWLQHAREHGNWSELRQTFQHTARKLIQKQHDSLLRIPQQVESLLQGENPTAVGLWDTTLQHGTSDAKFRAQVLGASTGETSAIARIESLLAPCLTQTRDSQCVVEQMRKEDWRDCPIDLDDDIDVYQNQLGGEDADELQQTLQESQREALEQVSQGLIGQSKALDLIAPEPTDDASTFLQNGSSAGSLLRIWRMFRARFPPDERRQATEREAIRHLQDLLCKDVLSKPLKKLPKEKLDGKLTQLWDEVPVFPSPWLHRFFASLTRDMYARGTDLWTPEAVTMLKQKAYEGISPQNFPTDPQGIFDRCYVSIALDHETAENEEGIKESANSYWKRTRVLFGFLNLSTNRDQPKET